MNLTTGMDTRVLTTELRYDNVHVLLHAGTLYIFLKYTNYHFGIKILIDLQNDNISRHVRLLISSQLKGAVQQ